MVSQCVNPKCGKSLHYLRDGKIFLLNVRSDEGSNVSRMEHFWLCGECSVKYIVKQVGSRVEVALKLRSRRPAELDHDSDSMPIAV
jgi:hypothetical protein